MFLENGLALKAGQTGSFLGSRLLGALVSCCLALRQVAHFCSVLRCLLCPLICFSFSCSSSFSLQGS